MVLASVSSSFTSAVANHGIYAVFGLMALGAVLPAASELVVLVAGAVAAGAFAGVTGITVFGSNVHGAGAYVALSLAGALGYFVGSLIGWAIGRYGGRELLERHGRWLHVTPESLDRAEAWFDRWGPSRRADRGDDAAPPLVRCDSGRGLRDAVRAVCGSHR